MCSAQLTIALKRDFREPEPKLEKAKHICRAAETAKTQIQAMDEAGQDQVVHAVYRKKINKA